MSSDLISLNRSRVTTVLNCRVGVEMKGRFTLLAAERGLNVSQLLSMIIDEALDQRNNQLLKSVTADCDSNRGPFSKLQEQFDSLQQKYAEQSEKVRNLEENNRKLSTGLKLRREQNNACMQDLEESRNSYRKVFQTNQDLISANKQLMKQFEISEQERNTLHEKMKISAEQIQDIQLKIAEVFKRLEEEDQGRFIDIPEWAWKIIRELPTV